MHQHPNPDYIIIIIIIITELAFDQNPEYKVETPGVGGGMGTGRVKQEENEQRSGGSSKRTVAISCWPC